MEDNNYSVSGDEGSVEASVHDSIQADSPSVDSVDTVSDDEEDETSAVVDNPNGPTERPENNEQNNAPVAPAVRKLQDNLGDYWNSNVIGSVVHEHCIGSAIREYNNLESVSMSPTPQ